MCCYQSSHYYTYSTYSYTRTAGSEFTKCKSYHSNVGVNRGSTLQWSHQIADIANRVSNIPNLPKCNLNKRPQDVKTSAYLHCAASYILCLCGIHNTLRSYITRKDLVKSSQLGDWV